MFFVVTPAGMPLSDTRRTTADESVKAFLQHYYSYFSSWRDAEYAGYELAGQF